METIQMLLKEMEQEAQTTRKMPERIPNNKSDRQPHVKSITSRKPVVHITELPSWINMTINTDHFDFD